VRRGLSTGIAAENILKSDRNQLKFNPTLEES